MEIFKKLFGKAAEPEVNVPDCMFGTFKRKTCKYASVNVGWFLNEVNKASFELCEDANMCPNRDERRRMYNAAKVLNLASSALQDILMQSSFGNLTDIPEKFKHDLDELNLNKE